MSGGNSHSLKISIFKKNSVGIDEEGCPLAFFFYVQNEVSTAKFGGKRAYWPDVAFLSIVIFQINKFKRFLK